MRDVKEARARGQRLKAARVARGLTQPALAERVGATQSMISQIERGIIWRPTKYHALIMVELGLPVDDDTARSIELARQAKERAAAQAASEAAWQAVLDAGR